MRAALTKEFEFESAHQLLNHAGKCKRVHGHNYKVEVQMIGDIKPADGRSDEGMVADFSIVGDIKSVLDHQNLNDVIGDEGRYPTTAENIALWIAQSVKELVVDGIEIGVTVWETDDSSARVTL